MARIRRIEVKNFIGIEDFALDAGKVNVLSGHKGAGKTSIIEALETGLTNKRRRVEVVRHGQNEATLFVELDDGLSVERKIRTDKADYLKVKKPGHAVPNTEAFLRRLISGEIFRPLEFVQKDPAEQAKIILAMLEIPWAMEDIRSWFGEVPEANYQAHILMILAQIEDAYYKQRTALNGEIAVLKAQVKGIKDDLPPNYNGEEWRKIDVRKLDAEIAELTEKNRQIGRAQELVAGLAEKVMDIRGRTESDKAAKVADFKNQRAEGREYIGFIRSKVEPLQRNIDLEPERVTYEKDAFDAEMEKKIQAIKDEYAKYKAQVEEDSRIHIDAWKFEISKFERTITSKETEIAGLDALETAALVAMDQQEIERIKTAEAEAGNAQELSGQETVDVSPLKARADQVSKMREHLHEWDRMNSIIHEKLAPKEEASKTLTARIDKARELPMQLLQTASVPVPGLTVDGEGKIRVNGTLISDLSDGEKLELAFLVARAQAGELAVICVDGIEKINPADRAALEAEMATDDYQYFITESIDGDLAVQIKEAEY